MDNRNNRIYITVSISIVLSIVLFQFFIKNVDINALWASVKLANNSLIFIGGLLLLLSHYLRAIRWTKLLKPIQSDIEIRSSFMAILIGTISNFVVPHVGELFRCTLLNKIEDASIELSIGTVIAERVIDVSFLFILILLGFILNVHFFDLSLFKISFLNTRLVFFLFLVVICLVFLGILFKKKILTLINKSVSQKIVEVKKGFIAVKQVNQINLFIGLSIAIWTLYFLSTYCLLQAIIPMQTISFNVVLAVLIMSSFGWAGPTQGGIGTFHILVSKALTINGFDIEKSNMISLFLHSISSSFDLLYGITAIFAFYFVTQSRKMQAKMMKL
jgi:glycosyltransferase 2 family protein